ncbi:MAG: UvrD-helicase domain-containing protein [Akkermansiaceae bacterium]|nr:UvrD-helicase domain-containing protein [Akkermansiaceae bacterium]
MNILQKNLLVLASAGSGKTFCLSDRVIGLMAKGVQHEEIVALTFTRKAAGEFADAILEKLAEAAEDPKRAAELQVKFAMSDVDFGEILENTVRSLPKLTLTTMDAFFAKIVRGFQYELGVTGGKFELLEGEVAETLRDGLMEGLLDRGVDATAEEEFVNVFRRATAGKEGVGVLSDLRRFIDSWHRSYVSPTAVEWGPAALAGVDIGDWEKQKAGLIDQVKRDWPNVAQTDKRQEKAFHAMMNSLQEHTVASGSLEDASSLLKSVMAASAEGSGALDVSFYKPLTITGAAAEGLRDLIELAARCELAAALARTRGIRGVIAPYDGMVDTELRGRGRLGFDDVKRLMGAWMQGEDARLRREAVDFRLDARYGHWLLDEFQDTSRDEWNALLPLIDEGVTNDESTVFVVGDRKQAIYAWRGGEVGLFDELMENYGGGLETATMAESWRSCPQVLDAVNRVCGDLKTMAALFGEQAAAEWQWEDHVSAEKLKAPEKAGYSRVEVLEKDDKAERVVELLHENGIGQKALTCGVLVSTNKQVTEWADVLRAEGFQVVEEGAREPGKDHPVGVMIWQLLRWLANPADDFAKQTVMMSPLKPVLEERFGAAWQAAWEGLGTMVSEKGFGGMLAEIVSPLTEDWSGYGKNRSSDLIAALTELDKQGAISAREAADWIGRMKISQSPGVAAVQVMTIHKSKGLGFDVVILPDIQTTKIPDFTHLHALSGDGWITAAPTSWARAMIPELHEAEQRWGDRQIYESFCKLYVAMTRAKRGLYLLLDTPAKKHDFTKPSLSNWIMASLGLDTGEEALFESGDPAWAGSVGKPEKPVEKATGSLGKPIQKRPRSTPSGTKAKPTTAAIDSGGGRRFGTAVHAAFENIGWIDEPVAADCIRPANSIATTISEILAVPEVAALFSKSGRDITLRREQRIEAVLDGKWMSGVIDRLHIHRDPTGKATKVEIIDFKTDRVETPADLRERYVGQMDSYRKVMETIHPDAKISCILVSTALGEVVAAD